MNGPADIKKADRTLEERGLPADSYFVAEFADGSAIDERDYNWSDMSESTRVGYYGQNKVVMLCTLPLVRLTVRHAGLEATVVVPEGARAYQAVRSVALMSPSASTQHSTVSRVVGLVVGGEVVEEQLIDGAGGFVTGVRK